MFIISLLIFILVSVAFCYLFYKILEIEKDIETLYTNYAKELEKVTKINLKKAGGERNVVYSMESYRSNN